MYKTLSSSILLFSTVVLLMGCQTSQQAGIQSATIQNRDVFTCKGLTTENRWVGVTDTFIPDEDTQVIVVAKFMNKDLSGRIFYELTNPSDQVVLNEEVRRPSHNPLGILFPMDRLLEVGDEGEWRATVYVNEYPIGDSIFYIGEKPEDADETGTEYFIVGEDSVEDVEAPVPVSEEERFSSYIKEVSPELDVPSLIETGEYTVIDAP